LLLLAAAAVPFMLARTLGEVGNTYAIRAIILVLAVCGLHVLVHWTGQISLAQATLMGVGAFATARANTDFSVPLPLAMLVGTMTAVLASLAIGLPALRIKGFALAVLTLAVAFAGTRWLFVQHWLVPQVSGIPLRSTGLLGFDITRSKQLVIPFGLLAVGLVWLTVAMGNSSLGRRMRMVAHDEQVAAAYGINVAAHKLVAFLFAGACAGMAGACTVVSIGRVGPGAFPLRTSVLLLSAVLLGGAGPVAGALQAAISFAVLPAFISGVGKYLDLIGPLSILLVVTTSPAGLNGLAEAATRALRAHPRRAQHYRHQPSDEGAPT
jgi:ABC-type branched-subunit amino acid transport system permease subunit